jgi:ATP-dependent RNA helicase SUPV3L1/SUV3
VPVAANGEGSALEQLRRELGLAPWQLQLAVEEGLITRRKDGRVSQGERERLLADPGHLFKQLHARQPLPLDEAAAELGIAPPLLRQATTAGVVRAAKARHGGAPVYRRSDLRAARERLAAWLAARGRPGPAPRRGRRDGKRNRAQTLVDASVQAKRRRIEARVSANLPVRRREPETVVAHVGPTNSGKTHDALRFLVEHGAGVYAAPLRMLAQEARATLAALAGEERVGLVTGEERVNETAPIVACTVEMAPRHGETLVLDEVQWAADLGRGSAWTRLLAEADYRHVRLLGAPDALPLLRSAFPQVEVRHHERLAPLDFVGERAVDRLEPGTVLISFSRKAVLALAAEVEQHRPGRVAALYGALPLGARRREIARFLSGEAEICVATDVLGHGVNLPCHTVLFAETSKFDGVGRRRLEAWEIAQIAGRAGRFGLADRGEVGVLGGVAWASPEPHLVEAALVPPLELEPGVRGYRIVDTGRLRPRLEELAVERADELPVALVAWQREAGRLVADSGWLELEPIDGTLARLEQVRQGTNLAALPVESAWTLANAPVDVDSDASILRACASSVADRSLNGRLRRLLGTDTRGLTLAEAELLARQASILRWFAQTFPQVRGLTADAARELEERAGDAAGALLGEELQETELARCAECGEPTAPWFRLCDACHRGRGAAVAAG